MLDNIEDKKEDY